MHNGELRFPTYLKSVGRLPINWLLLSTSRYIQICSFQYLLGYFPFPCNMGAVIVQRKASLIVRTDRHTAHRGLKVQSVST